MSTGTLIATLRRRWFILLRFIVALFGGFGFAVKHLLNGNDGEAVFGLLLAFFLVIWTINESGNLWRVFGPHIIEKEFES